MTWEKVENMEDKITKVVETKVAETKVVEAKKENLTVVKVGEEINRKK